jgi:hypothetical protein
MRPETWRFGSHPEKPTSGRTPGVKVAEIVHEIQDATNECIYAIEKWIVRNPLWHWCGAGLAE